MVPTMNAIEVYRGSDGDATKRMYSLLERQGPVGIVAMNLFRAQKCSERAKVYRGGIPGRGSYKAMAYERKNWAIANLCSILLLHADRLGIIWGWKIDPDQVVHSWVLYVEIPGEGQVSFHSANRMDGPDYPGEFDGQHASAGRIIAFCQAIIENGEEVSCLGK